MKKIKLSLLASILLIFGVATIVSAKGFKDVPQSHWAYNFINWGEEKEIVKGFPDGSFYPNQKVTEAEFLAMLIRAYDPGTFGYAVNNEHWADSYYYFSLNMNYPTTGIEDYNKRNSPINRTHVAEIIAGTQGVNYTGENAIHYLLVNELAQGKLPGEVSIKGFDGESTLTRAEAVTFLKNVMENGLSDRLGKPIIAERPKNPSNPEDLQPLPTPQPKFPSEPQEEEWGEYELALYDAFDGTNKSVVHNGSDGVFIYKGERKVENIIAGYSFAGYTSNPGEPKPFMVITVYKIDDDSLQTVKTMFEAVGATDTDDLINNLKKALNDDTQIKKYYGPYETIIYSETGSNTITIEFEVNWYFF